MLRHRSLFNQIKQTATDNRIRTSILGLDPVWPSGASRGASRRVSQRIQFALPVYPLDAHGTVDNSCKERQSIRRREGHEKFETMLCLFRSLLSTFRYNKLPSCTVDISQYGGSDPPPNRPIVVGLISSNRSQKEGPSEVQ